MAKNIIIYPSPVGNPTIEFYSSVNNTPLSLNVLTGSVITLGNNSLGISISVDPTNALVSGSTLNVKDYLSVGGIQVLNDNP